MEAVILECRVLYNNRRLYAYLQSDLALRAQPMERESCRFVRFHENTLRIVRTAILAKYRDQLLSCICIAIRIAIRIAIFTKIDYIFWPQNRSICLVCFGSKLVCQHKSRFAPNINDQKANVRAAAVRTALLQVSTRAAIARHQNQRFKKRF